MPDIFFWQCVLLAVSLHTWLHAPSAHHYPSECCCLDAGVDRLGVYLYVQRLGQAGEVVRVAFLRPIIDERHARSSLTLMAQLAWERERSYVPVRCLARPLGPTCSCSAP